MPTATKSTSNDTNARNTAAAAQQQLLNGVRQSQQIALDAAASWAAMASKAMPVSAPTIPGMPSSGDLKEVVSASFGLVQELVSTQQAFVEQLLATLLPAAEPTATPV